MAITLISGPTPRYIGTEAERSSMDPKPVVGAEYFESDTGLTYVFVAVDLDFETYPVPAGSGNGETYGDKMFLK